MTPKQRPPASAFTSFRIIGKRAQDILQRARQGEPRTPSGRRPARAAEPVVTIRLPSATVLRSTLTILGVAVAVWLAYMVRDTIMLLLLGFFLAAIIDPGVRSLERRGVPRGLAILVQYAVALVLILFLLLSLTPILAQQITGIAQMVSERLDRFLVNPQIAIPLLPPDLNMRFTELARGTLQNLSIEHFADVLAQWGQNLSSVAQGSFVFATRVAGSVVGFIVQTIVVLVLAFFIQIEKERVRVWLRGFLPEDRRGYFDAKIEAALGKIGQWARGQLILGLVVGLLVFVALAILGIPYALTLAVLAGFTEFIPYIGPFIAAVPAVLIALTEGGFLWALVVMGIYYVIQWCENNLLVPLIMKRAVGLSPIAIMVAMLVGISFPGVVHPILGILLAIPFTTIVALFLEDLRQR
ncbi:MAG: hypothetical protein G01um101425_817 [Candidatus Peregrinibacteria bacterium Gr01-1014_25]|nr:MAG: hypothetical protein G01um101425_817 [Candidatus Peregrinibacteria bacterium Gr01-1014_25]